MDVLLSIVARFGVYIPRTSPVPRFPNKNACNIMEFGNVADVHSFSPYRFLNCVFPDGHMAEALGRGGLGPAGTGVVVFEDFDGRLCREEDGGSGYVGDEML